MCAVHLFMGLTPLLLYLTHFPVSRDFSFIFQCFLAFYALYFNKYNFSSIYSMHKNKHPIFYTLHSVNAIRKSSQKCELFRYFYSSVSNSSSNTSSVSSTSSKSSVSNSSTNSSTSNSSAVASAVIASNSASTSSFTSW